MSTGLNINPIILHRLTNKSISILKFKNNQQTNKQNIKKTKKGATDATESD